MKGNLVVVFTVVAVILIVFGILTGDVAIMANMIVIALLISLVPIFFYKYSRFLWIKSIEEQFPNLLRDLADLISSGMSFSEAIRIASKSNYGKLTTEVKKMNNRLSWGTPFLRVLDIFGKKTRHSKIITEVLHIVRESYRSGGNIAATLDSLANNIIMLREAERERESMVKQQVFIMYGIFFIFLAITILIINVLVPMISGATEESTALTLQFKDPCANTFMFPCPLYSAIGVMLNTNPGISSYYTSLFFLTVIIEAIFIGLIAGQLGSNSVSAGLKHSLIMLFVGIGVFLFLAKLGFFL